MLAEITDPSNYAFNVNAAPTALTVVALVALTFKVLIQERASQVSRLFLLMVSTIAIWLAAFSFMYCSKNEQTAILWARLAYLGVPLIPSAIFHFTVAVLRIYPRYRRLLWISWVFSIGFSMAIVGTNALVSGLYQYWWGYYPRYGWLSLPYLTFFFGMMFVTFYCYWSEYRKTLPGSPHYWRVRAFLIAFAIVYLGSVDYLPKFGIAIYPFGFLPILFFLAFIARAVRKYRLVDIAPELARAEPILNSVGEPLLVMDMEGTIRLVNRASSEMLGLSEDQIRGRPVKTFFDHPFLGGAMGLLIERLAAQREFEITYVHPKTGARLLLVSISVIRDNASDLQAPTAVLFFLRDITSRKFDETRLARITELVEDWRSAFSSRARHPSVDISAEDKPVALALAQPFLLRSGWRMIGSFALILTIPMMVLLWLQVRQARRAMEGQVWRQNTTTARVSAKVVHEHFNGLAHYLESFASRPALVDLLRLEDKEAIRKQLEDLVWQHAEIGLGFIVDAQGRLVASYPENPHAAGEDFSNQEWFQMVLRQQETIVSNVFERAAQPHSVLLVNVLTPIRNAENQVVGYLGGQHTLEALERWLRQNLVLEAGTVTLVDRMGRIAARSLPHESIDPARMTPPVVEQVLSGGEGSLTLKDPSTHQVIQISYTPVDPFGWVVLVSHPLEDMLAPIREFQGFVAMLVFAMLGIMLLLGSLWLNSLRRSHHALLAVSASKEKALEDLKHTLVERRQVEETLQRLAFLVESSSEAIIGESFDRVIVSWNKAAERLFSYTAEEVKGRSALMLVPREIPDEVPAVLDRIRQGDAVEPFETVRVRKDGTRVSVLMTVSPVKDAEGHAIGASVIARDITERKRIQEALRVSEERFRSVVESARDAIISADSYGRVVSWNKGAESIFGYERDDVMGKPLTFLMPERFRQAHQHGFERFRNSGESRLIGRTLELAGQRKDGGEFPLELSLSMWATAEGQFVTSIIRDITERKQGEEDLRQVNLQLSERQRALTEALSNLHKTHEELQSTQLQLIQVAKMESVGRLAAGVAHEVKNPLATILMGIDVLTDHFTVSDESVSALLRDMNRAVRRADAVIKGLLDFSAPHELKPTEEDLNAIIEQALVLVKHALDRSHVLVIKNLGSSLPALHLDRVKLEQVFLNLFMNAVQSMSGRGSITVTTEAIPLQEFGHSKLSRRHEDWHPKGDTVVVAYVDDTGPGIPEDKLAKVFDPFFTTKPTGQGTGLGLTVSKKIIELHGGMISIHNRQEGGAQVTLIFNV